MVRNVVGNKFRANYITTLLYLVVVLTAAKSSPKTFFKQINGKSKMARRRLRSQQLRFP